MTTINDFTQNFTSGQRSNLYQVEITDFEEKLKFVCKAAQIPGKTINPIEIKYLSHTLKYAGDPVFEDWTATILHDEDHSIRTILDEWQEKIIANADSIGASQPGDYYKEIRVSQIKRDGNINSNGVYVLHNAWPTTVEPMDLGFENSDTIVEYGVTFSFSHWVKG